jgi:hypothetical protein
LAGVRLEKFLFFLFPFLGRFNVLVRATNHFDLLPVFFSVAEIDESFVTAVGAFDAPRVLDRTPVLLGPGGDLIVSCDEPKMVDQLYTSRQRRLILRNKSPKFSRICRLQLNPKETHP